MNFVKFTGKRPLWESFYQKRDSCTTVVSCEFCEIFKNTFFAKQLWATTFLKSR